MQFYEQLSFHNYTFIKISGFLLTAVGLITAITGCKQLGLKRSLCINFYYNDVSLIKTPLYKHISHPQDYGLITALTGMALATGYTFDLFIAGLVTVLLLPHQYLENIPLQNSR